MRRRSPTDGELTRRPAATEPRLRPVRRHGGGRPRRGRPRAVLAHGAAVTLPGRARDPPSHADAPRGSPGVRPRTRGRLPDDSGVAGAARRRATGRLRAGSGSGWRSSSAGRRLSGRGERVRRPTVDQRPLPFPRACIPRSGQLNPSCYADLPMSSEPTGVPAHRSPDGTWRVVRTRRPSSQRNDRSRWHERHEDRGGGGRRWSPASKRDATTRLRRPGDLRRRDGLPRMPRAVPRRRGPLDPGWSKVVVLPL